MWLWEPWRRAGLLDAVERSLSADGDPLTGPAPGWVASAYVTAGTKQPRRYARVVEPRDPRQPDGDEQHPPREVVAPGTGGSHSADGNRDRLRPRLQLPEVTGGDHDTSLDRGEAEP